MKVVKSQVVLYMHEKLLLDEELDSKEIKDMFELDNKKFYRYMQEIKSYYSNMFKTDKIVYSKKNMKYYLVRSKK